MKTREIYSEKALSAYNKENLLKIANEELELGLSEELTKAQLKKAIQAAQAGEGVTSTEGAPTNEEAVQEEKKADKPIIGEILNITECEVGDVIRYLSSKKLYLVAEKGEKGGKPYSLLVSATQTYNSYKQVFSVNRVMKADNATPEAYEKLLSEFKSEKNVDREALVKKAEDIVKERKAAADAKAKKDAEEAEAKKQEEENAVAEGTQEESLEEVVAEATTEA